jgi:hypothetical protein
MTAPPVAQVLTGCPAGCGVAHEDECPTNLPIPRPRACWDCAAVGVDSLARGYGCCPEHSVKGTA